MQDKVLTPPSKALFTFEGRYFSPGMLLVVLLILLSWLSIFDQKTIDFIDKSLLQSIAAFATAKGLNGAIGVIESLDITILGTASFEIGKILSPAKELIDQFTEIMEYVIGSLILQKLLITISSNTFFKILLTLAGLAFIVFRAFRYQYHEFYNHYGTVYKVFITVLFTRFFFIVVFGVSTIVDSAFIANTTKEKITSIESIPGEVDPMAQMNTEERDALKAIRAQLSNFNGELETEQAKLLSLNSDVKQLKELRQTNENKIIAIDQQLSLKERYLGSDDQEKQQLFEARKRLKEQLARYVSQLDKTESQQDLHRDNIERHKEKIVDLEKAIASSGKGTLVMVKSLGVDFIKSAKEKLEIAADTALELTVLFIFKSILMPLLFILICYKVFLNVWRFDIRKI